MTHESALDRKQAFVQRRSLTPSAVARKESESQSSGASALRQRGGNQGIQTLLRAHSIQAKLTINQRGDAHEREADRVADAVMRMPALVSGMQVTSPASKATSIPTLQRLCAECDDKLSKKTAPGNQTPNAKGAQIQRKEGAAPAPQVTPPVAASIEAMRGGGSSLPAATRAFFEPRFGTDFSHVRVHTGSRAEEAAKSIGAKAFTLGRDIGFSRGQYAPESYEGRRLLAHELTHVVQQSGSNGIPAAESTAEAMSIRFKAQTLQRKEAEAGLRPATPRPQCQNDRLTTQQYVVGVQWLEEQGNITTEEAVSLKEHIPSSRRARCRLIEALARRAQTGRQGKVSQPLGSSASRALIENFQVVPRIIRVEEGEAARISFDVRGDNISSLACMILKYEFSSERSDSRFFTFPATPGHKVAVWDGTFTGSRNKAPEPGAYRVRVLVSDDTGRREEVFEQIRVVNSAGSTVLPRTQSGLSLRELEFNGSEAVLTDSGGNAIRAKAVSGLRPNNPRNPTHIDYTSSRYQCTGFRGPIPKGKYFIDANAAQQPELVRGKLRYPTGSQETGWGPFRIPLRPADHAATCGRSEFFFHLDVHDDGTAGCIGLAAGEESKFNQMVALMMRIQPGETLEVVVSY